MNNTEEQLIQEFREKFGDNFTHCCGSIQDCKLEMTTKEEEEYINSIFDFLLHSIREAEQRVAEDICSMTDDIEVSNYADSSMEIWKLFKHIRNSLRDKYVLSSTADANKMVVNKEECGKDMNVPSKPMQKEDNLCKCSEGNDCFNGCTGLKDCIHCKK